MPSIAPKNTAEDIQTNASRRVDIVLHLLIIAGLSIALCCCFYMYGYSSAECRWKQLYYEEQKENLILKDTFRLKGWEKMKVITITNDY